MGFICTRRIADIYNRTARWYDLLMRPLEFFLLRRKRRKLVNSICGKVLEIGIGTGANLAYYNRDVILTGIDASTEMLALAKRKAKKRGLTAEFIEMNAEKLHFADGSFDAVVSTLVLCTVSDPVKTVQEMMRVCKKGGRLLFLEHGKSNVGWVARLQEKKAGKHFQKHHCRLLGEPINLLISTGLRIKTCKRFFLGIFNNIEVEM
jgi:ubiquinone/menaquinone biosynthesis C-methylase UbiE